MKSTGIVRRLDVLGRVVVPKEIRKILQISEGDPLEIYTEKDSVILKKFSPLSLVDELVSDISSSLCRQTGKSVFICDKNSFLSCSGICSKEILSCKISSQISSLIKENKTLIVCFEDGGSPIFITENESYGFNNQLFMPIQVDDEAFGGILLCDRNRENRITSKDVELLSLSTSILASRFK